MLGVVWLRHAAQYWVTLYERGRCEDFPFLDAGADLKCIDDRLAAKVVVRNDIGLGGVLTHFGDLLHPRVELLFAVEIVVAGITAGIFPKPVLVVPPMKAYVADRACGAVRRSYGTADLRLVDIAERYGFFCQEVEERSIVPRRMADLDDEWIADKAVE